jgi:hypothetical protein
LCVGPDPKDGGCQNVGAGMPERLDFSHIPIKSGFGPSSSSFCGSVDKIKKIVAWIVIFWI